MTARIQQRKKPAKRAFSGLVGLPPEPSGTEPSRLPAPPMPVPPVPKGKRGGGGSHLVAKGRRKPLR